MYDLELRNNINNKFYVSMGWSVPDTTRNPEKRKGRVWTEIYQTKFEKVGGRIVMKSLEIPSISISVFWT